MGRHASSSTTAHDGSRIRRPGPVVLVAALAVIVLVAGGLVWWLAGSDGSDSAACGDPQVVRVTVTPELAPVAEKLLSDDALAGDCAAAEVSAQESLPTVGALTTGSETGASDVWVPDSSTWLARVQGDVRLEPDGSAARSPIVFGTSRAAAEQLGWDQTSPGWLEASQQGLQAGLPFVAPDLVGDARQLGAVLAALRAMGPTVSDDALAALLAVAQNGVTRDQVRDAAVRGDADAGVFSTSEQDVISSHLAGDSALVALYPDGGSPWLDYPVVRVGDPGNDRRAAVDAVVAALTSDDAAAAVRAAGFRDADGGAPDDAGPDTGTRAEAPEEVPFDAEAAQAALDQTQRQLAPARMLTVIDTSTSMAAQAGNSTRIDLAVDAATSALSLLPDGNSVGLWSFAYKVSGDDDWQERVPLRALDTAVSGSSQRDVLTTQLNQLPTQLGSGGTGLYDTTLAAVRAARQQYEEGSVSSVVLLTDGANDDDAGGISLQGLIDTLTAEADPARPVELIGVAFGPEADLQSLQQIAAATGGRAYSAVDPDDLQGVLFDALRQR